MPKRAVKRTEKNIYRQSLSINQLALELHLGIGEKERSKKQKVTVDMQFYMPAALSSSESDNGEYICYHSLCEKIYKHCMAREYRLIEFLTMEIYRLIRKELNSKVKVAIKLNKLKILLPYVEGGTSFSYTDLPQGAWVVPS